jgi:protocatechuate 3,4-dioxygenase beta subunit
MSAALGGIVLAAPLKAIFAQPVLTPTIDQVLGPFYPVTKPLDHDADLTVIQGKPGKAQGQVIHLMGRVLNLKGDPIPGAQVEIWQANTFGRYTHPSDTNPAPLDPNFEGFGAQITDAEGRYRFKTIKPGAYPVPVEGWIRPPHIHFDVTSKSNRLITQLYFEGEPLNDKDLLLQPTLNKGSVMTRLLPPTKDVEPDALLAVWDIVLPQM